MTAAHSVLAPSSAAQWGRCSGSIRAKAVFQDRETDQSREGTAAHWLVAEVLKSWKHPHQETKRPSDYLGTMAENGCIIDGKMVDGAEIMVLDVLKVAQEHGALSRLLIEERVAAPQIHKLNWGTLDAAFMLGEKSKIYIWDYKHGHRENRAKGNLQLINYVAGLVNAYDIRGDEDPNIVVHIRIVQPFTYRPLGPVDEWVVKLSDLRADFNQLHMKAHDAFLNPTLSSGSWCRDCSAVGNCPAARLSAYSLIEYSNEAFLMDQMDSINLANERGILKSGLKAAEARLDAVEDELKRRISAGDVNTGLTLETTPGRLRWDVPVAQAVAFARNFGVDAQKTDVLTPTQVKNKAKKEMKTGLEIALKNVTTRPAGAPALVPLEDSIGARAFKINKLET